MPVQLLLETKYNADSLNSKRDNILSRINSYKGEKFINNLKQYCTIQLEAAIYCYNMSIFDGKWFNRHQLSYMEHDMANCSNYMFNAQQHIIDFVYDVVVKETCSCNTYKPEDYLMMAEAVKIVKDLELSVSSAFDNLERKNKDSQISFINKNVWYEDRYKYQISDVYNALEQTLEQAKAFQAGYELKDGQLEKMMLEEIGYNDIYELEKVCGLMVMVSQNVLDKKPAQPTLLDCYIALWCSMRLEKLYSLNQVKI